MKPPKEYIRITLDDKIPHVSGIYILAYLGRVLYIGKSQDSVCERINSHRSNALCEALGAWMIRCGDFGNVRLDILVSPHDDNSDIWLRNAESACVRQFKPLFNEQLQ